MKAVESMTEGILTDISDPGLRYRTLGDKCLTNLTNSIYSLPRYVNTVPSHVTFVSQRQ